nr:hypothetical protein [Tanacetum cinerariifolium]
IMPPKRRYQTNPQPTLTQEAVYQLVRDGIEAAIRDERESFYRTEGDVGLVRWFEKMENTFEISKCAKGKKIIIENVPPPNNNPNVPEKELILDQAPAALVEFAPQWIGGQILDNNNGWLKEDPEEELEEEEIEDKDMVNDEEDDAEEEPSIYTAPVPRADDPYDMMRDAAMDTRGDRDFHGTKGAIRLVRWFKKMENTFEISREVANRRPWTEVKQMMTDEFCPTEEVKRLEDKLRHLKLKDINIVVYTERFNELALLCPDDVPNEKKKVKLYIKGLHENIKGETTSSKLATLNEAKKVNLYIKGLHENIKGETTSSKLATLNEAVRMAHTLMEQKIQEKNERIAEGLKKKSKNNNQCNNNNNNNHNQGAAVQPNVVCYKCGKRGHK